MLSRCTCHKQEVVIVCDRQVLLVSQQHFRHREHIPEHWLLCRRFCEDLMPPRFFCTTTRQGLSVGCGVQHVYLPQAEVDAIVQRLSAKPEKAKGASWQTRPAAVKLTYVRDPAKGHKEVYVPLKKVGAPSSLRHAHTRCKGMRSGSPVKLTYV